MRTGICISVFLAGSIFALGVRGQSVERERPAEWEGLVAGGRFMDLFLPMPVQGELTRDTWGAEGVKPRYTENGLEDREWSYWGGKAVCGDDGRYHLFVCRWLESSPRGHHEWSRSIVVHAVSDLPTGPYTVKDTVGPGHNPEVFRMKDGRYVIYVINGYYISDGVEGPWTYGKFEFDARDRRIIEGLSNLTFAQREDGSFLMICRGGGVWFSETGISPYYQVTDRRVYPPVAGNFEDPVVWRTGVQYHLIVNDWLGRIAYYLRSRDGIQWTVDPGEAYLPGIAKYEDGTVEDWFKYERIKVLQDEYGRAMQAHFAVIDVLKNDDKGGDEHSSKHICIPLTTGRLLTILNEDKIMAKTPWVRVKILAEADFNPLTDMDMASLRFGASDAVNFGGGSKVLGAEPDGRDLIVTFDGSGHGMTDQDFVAKLLGRTRSGNLLFGYARLPWLEYLEPALSARMPVVETRGDGGLSMSVEVQNFGQVPSRESVVKVFLRLQDREEAIATGVVPVLRPFAKTVVALASVGRLELGTSHKLKVVIESPSQDAVFLEGTLVPQP